MTSAVNTDGYVHGCGMPGPCDRAAVMERRDASIMMIKVVD